MKTPTSNIEKIETYSIVVTGLAISLLGDSRAAWLDLGMDTTSNGPGRISTAKTQNRWNNLWIINCTSIEKQTFCCLQRLKLFEIQWLRAAATFEHRWCIFLVSIIVLKLGAKTVECWQTKKESLLNWIQLLPLAHQISWHGGFDACFRCTVRITLMKKFNPNLPSTFLSKLEIHWLNISRRQSRRLCTYNWPKRPDAFIIHSNHLLRACFVQFCILSFIDIHFVTLWMQSRHQI